MEEIKRRLNIVHIDLDLLTELLRQDGTRKYAIEGMPEDARIVAASDFVFDKNEIIFRVESKEFPEVSRGSTIPELKLVVRRINEPMEMVGYRKANELLNKALESVCEKLDVLKHQVRQLKKEE